MSDPIDLPDVGYRSVEFDPVRPRATERMEGRRTETQTFGTPWWVAKYTVQILSRADFGKLDAFQMSAGDDGETFRAYDVYRPRPILEDLGVPLSGVKAGGGAFDGTATIETIVSSREIDIQGLPAGFQLSTGDYVEFREAGQSSLHRLLAAVTADVDGKATLTIAFGLDTQNFTDAAEVRFEKPSCLMQVDPGSFSGPKTRVPGDRSFSATEVFIAVEE